MTKAVVYMDKEDEGKHDLPEKTIVVTGSRNEAEAAKREIESIPSLIRSCQAEES